MTIDIHSKGEYPANELSNFFPHEFIIDEVFCAGMEGFLQSLKFKNKEKQKSICALYGKSAKNKGKRKFLWKLTGILYWQGKKIPRNGKEYQDLLNRVYSELNKNQRFKKALDAADGAELVHSCGKDNPKKTILTVSEFISHLENLRK